MSLSGQPSLGRSFASWGLALSLVIATAAGWLANPRANVDPLIVLVLWFNILVVVTALGVEIGRRPYSLHVMHLLSLFLFLGAASLLQYSIGRFGVAGSIGQVRGQILPAVAATTLWIVGYLAAYEGRRLLRAARAHGVVSRFLGRPLTPARALLVAGIGVLALVYLAAAGLGGAATRGAATTALEDFAMGAGAGRYTSPLFIATYSLARSVPLVALLAVLLLTTRDRSGWRVALIPLILVLSLGTLVLNNPFAASRIYLTTTIFAFAAPFLLRRFKTAWALVLAVLVGLTLLPALSASRNVSDLSEFKHFLFLASPLDYLATNSDVDSLGMTALCQQWVDRFGHRWGLQILGALLSWVPRALWPGKPIATGGMVTGDLGFEFTNLSPPLPAEALVDFGLVGVPVLGVIFGLILERLDACYWGSGREALGSSLRIADVIYPFWLVCVVLFTRGDLFASVTHTAGFTLWILPLGVGLAAHARASAQTRSPVAVAGSGRRATPLA